MNETAREWLAKADGDYHTASRELQAVEAAQALQLCTALRAQLARLAVE